MSKLISSGIRQLASIDVPADLSKRSLERLDTVPTRRRTNFVLPVLAVAAMIAIFAFVAPRYATAMTLESIKQAMKGKVMHLRTFALTGDVRVLESEMWTDGDRMRHVEKGKLGVSDGTKTVEIDEARRTAKSWTTGAFTHAPSGFTLDAMLSDMRKTQNLGSVDIRTMSVDGRDSLVAELSDNYSRFVLLCDEGTRLPYRIEVTDKKSARRQIMEVEFLDSVDESMFQVSVPEGYKVVDLDKGFDDFATETLYRLRSGKAVFELYSVDLNERGDVYVLFGTDHLKEVKLEIGSTHAGPIKLEYSSSVRRSLVNGRQAYIWVWATGRSDLKSVSFNVSISGQQAVSHPISPTRTKGEPVYATHAIETSAYAGGFVTVDDLRAAVAGPVLLPLVKLDDLEIVATFDAMGAQVFGTVLNKSKKALSNVGLVYKIRGTDLFGVTIVRVGHIAPGKTVPFKQSLARITERHSLPVIAIEFDSIYDESKPLSVSPD